MSLLPPITRPIPEAATNILFRKLPKITLNPQAEQLLTDKKESVWKKIWDVATNIFKVAVTVFLYWTNPTLCAVGFITGIIYDDQVIHAIKKIKAIWTTQPWSTTIIGGVASFFSLPVTLAAGSFLWAAHLGSLMSQEAQKLMLLYEI